ncbi:hypothetical protein D9615_001726 [Tricholomella constricta]|uniref:PHD-type domain-containing protein n=1 Tax=Tricholomella constricta TaxID=117010 RepID=A0A8H5HP50_9AGAR|nr:hypothetical protein D9615_001726 [Tricholomella constricta]
MASTASMPAYMSSGVPVFQPPHLEGDPSLATEILPGPPSVVSTQQSILKRDPRKPSAVFSYLPPSDPGSTYSGIMHGTLIGHEPDATRLKRSKTAIGRAQRASARNQNGTTSGLDPPADGEPASASNLHPISVDLEPDTMVIDDDLSISMSSSSQNLQESVSASIVGRSKRKDKGKGREVESAIVRVKEEPKAVSLQTPDPPVSNLLNNDDHCSSCRSYGALVYCDGCPRAFHLWCLDPPMESVDEGDSRWFCPSCTIRKHPPQKPPSSLLSSLIQLVDLTIPTEFQLPEDVRTFFKDVGTGPKGTYVDTSELKQPRLNRHGQLEDRDAHRLRDRNGAPVLCFRCGTSALPGGLAAAAPAAKRARRSSTLSKVVPEAWKSMVSCDYCNLHWHLDCLDPPLSTMPPFSKKWMCPNHAEKILAPKHRVPKQNAAPLEITKPQQFNNGNIEIIHPESTRTFPHIPKVAVDEVLINGRRYRVPERVIVLDFWNKLNKSERQADKDSNFASGMSSPLTSLSSLDDLDDQTIPELPLPRHDPEDLKVAQMLCSLQISKSRLAESSSQPPINGSSNGARQTDTEPATSSRNSRVIKLSKVSASKVSDVSLKATAKASGANGAARALKAQRNTAANEYLPASTAKRKKPIQPPPPEPSTRELRSRSKNNFDSSLTSISSRSSMKRADDSGRDSMVLDGPISAPLPPAPGKSRSFQVKLEEIDSSFVFGSTPAQEAGPSSETPLKFRRGRGKQQVGSALASQKDPVMGTTEAKEKRGRKRKERDDDLPATDGQGLGAAAEKSKKEKKERRPRKKPTRTPARRGPVFPIVPVAPVSASHPATATPATPSLKIRLPRLNNSGIHASPSIPNTNGDTPTRL